MANLETLELTINANAESASRGLGKLIDSLTALSRKVGSTISGLKQLNAELQTLSGFSGVKMPNLEKAMSSNRTVQSVKATTNALKQQTNTFKANASVLKEYRKLNLSQFRSWMYGPKPLPTITNLTGQTQGMLSDEELKKSHPEWFWNPDNPEELRAKVEARNAALQLRGDKLPIALNPRTLKQFDRASESKLINYLNQTPDYSHLGEYVNQSLGIGVKGKSAKDSASAFMEQMKESIPLGERLKTGFGKLSERFGTFRGIIRDMLPRFHALNRVMRIASTMLIRMGVRALFNGAKEGLNNYYQYAKATNNAFAQGMDSIASTWAVLKNQMGAAIAPALSAAVPVLNALASAATIAFNALSQLFALLSGQSTWSKAKNQVQSYGDAVNKANGGGGGGGLKEMLANFDELNVIASEGGGGGGGSAVQAAEAFEDMFEEIGEFDEKIRALADFVKQTIGWIKDNFDTILTTAGLIGLAILGWRMSQNFEGALGQLGKYIAGGALIAVGIVLEYDFGKKVGAALAGGKPLEWEDILEGILGFVAAGIGGYLITGTIGGAMIGLGIALFAFITGVIVGYNDQLDRNKWGNIELTKEQIEEFVKNRFTFDVTAEVNILNAHVNNSRAARAHLDREIWEFSNSLRKITLGVDTSDKAYEDAIAKFGQLKDRINEWLKTDQELLTVYFEIMPFDEGTEKGMITDVFEADKKLKDYFENAGKQMADLFDQGMRTGWANNEKEQILALMDHIDNIMQKSEELYQKEKLELGTKSLLARFTRDTAEDILKEQKAQLDEFRKAAEQANQELVDSLLRKAAYAEAAGLTGEAETYRKAAETLVKEFETAYSTKLSASMGVMKQEWINGLKEVYGIDYSDFTNTTTDSFIEDLERSFAQGEAQGIKTVTDYMTEITNINPITRDASQLFGITGWDLLADDQKRKLFNAMVKSIGFDAITLLKKSLNIPATDVVNVSGWETFSSAQKLQFVNSLAKAYGSYEALNAAKNGGINVVNELNQGIRSQNPEVSSAAKELMTTLRATIGKNGKIFIPVSAESDPMGAYNVISGMASTLQSWARSYLRIFIPVGVQSDGSSVETAVHDTKNGGKMVALHNIPGAILEAEGGFPPMGSVFIAGEAGAELVGTINGRTGVANTDQIVTGIAEGVAAANSEQNALLRQQNELLRGILEKDASVRIGASAALGRVARQSLDMYGSLVGG